MSFSASQIQYTRIEPTEDPVPHVTQIYYEAEDSELITEGFPEPKLYVIHQFFNIERDGQLRRADNLTALAEKITFPIPLFLSSELQKVFLNHLMASITGGKQITWLAAIKREDGKLSAHIMLRDRERGSNSPACFLGVDELGTRYDEKEIIQRLFKLWQHALSDIMPLECAIEHSPCFGIKDLSRILKECITAAHMPASVKRISEKIISYEESGMMLRLFDVDTGRDNSLFTTPAVRKEERDLFKMAKKMHATSTHALKKESLHFALEAFPTMTDDQQKAFMVATAPEQLALINGWAGTGKSYLMRAIAEAYEGDGYNVIVLSPTNSVAADIHKNGFADSRTAHRLVNQFRMALQFNRESISKKINEQTLIILDEAFMIPNNILMPIMDIADRTGAKLILVGSDIQLPSVTRGGMFGYLSKQFKTVTLKNIIRQKHDYYRIAAEYFAQQDFQKGLAILDDLGWICWEETAELAQNKLINDWEKATRHGLGDRFAFAYTNRVIETMNDSMQGIRLTRGDLDEAGRVTVMRMRDNKLRQREIIIGLPHTDDDIGTKIIFHKNDKEQNIINGMLGTVLAFNGIDEIIVASGDPPEEVVFNPELLPEFDLGYAATIYKGQGLTFDETYMLFSPHWNRKTAYVALTRARHKVGLYVDYDSIGFNPKYYSDEFEMREMRLEALALSMMRDTHDESSLFYRAGRSRNIQNMEHEVRRVLKRNG